MRKGFLFGLVLLLAGAAWGLDLSSVKRQDLSLKAGPTEPGEQPSIAWMETFVYPKLIDTNRNMVLGARISARADKVTVTFDFSKDKIALNSLDGMSWSENYKVAEAVAPGLHVARFTIVSGKGSIQRTVDFMVGQSLAERSTPSIPAVHNWPLTVTASSAALVGNSSRPLQAGEKITGIARVPFYQVTLPDGTVGFVPAGAVNDPVSYYYQQGYRAYTEQNYARAIELYQNTVALDPDFVKGYLWLAKSYQREGNMDAAVDLAREALRRDERNMDVKIFANALAYEYYNIGVEKFNEGRFNEAAAIFRNVLELKPTSLSSWVALSRCYAKLGLDPEARGALHEALKVDPNFQSASLPGKQPEPAASAGLSPALTDDLLAVLKNSKTSKGTRLEAAIRSVISMTKSLGTPVREKGWEVKKSGDKFIARYVVEEGKNLQSFDWQVDIDSKNIAARNDNARLLMSRW